MNLKQLATLLLSKSTRSKRCLVGFDGFTDRIMRCVQTRKSVASATFYKNISDFAQKVAACAGTSGNFELVLEQIRLGGNGPILANALVQSGLSVSLIGAVGDPDIEELFKPLTQRCEEVFSLGPSARTTALEFNDGKLLLGEHESVLGITVGLIEEKIGKAKLIQLFEQSDLFVFANWTMILSMTDIWKYLLKSVLPKISNRKRIGFFDLADPRKRAQGDLKEALVFLTKMQSFFDVVLGLNVSESEQIASVLGLKSKDILKRAKLIQKKLHIDQVVIHAHDKAMLANDIEALQVDGPYCKNPLITTGGGDNFNAGFCLARLLDLDATSTLILATYTSGYYVRYGQSPTRKQLSDFLLKS